MVSMGVMTGESLTGGVTGADLRAMAMAEASRQAESRARAQEKALAQSQALRAYAVAGATARRGGPGLPGGPDPPQQQQQQPQQFQMPPPSSRGAPRPGGGGGREPLGLDVLDFMPPRPIPSDSSSSSSASAAAAAAQGPEADAALLASLRAQHGPLASVLASRLTGLQAVRTLWSRGDVRSAVDAMARAGDGVVVDVLGGLGARPEGLTLEAAAGIAPLLAPLLASRHERPAGAALGAAAVVLRCFGPLMAATKAGQAASPGVDLAAAARRERCEACAAALARLRPQLETLVAGGGQQVSEDDRRRGWEGG